MYLDFVDRSKVLVRWGQIECDKRKMDLPAKFRLIWSPQLFVFIFLKIITSCSKRVSTTSTGKLSRKLIDFNDKSNNNPLSCPFIPNIYWIAVNIQNVSNYPNKDYCHILPGMLHSKYGLILNRPPAWAR